MNEYTTITIGNGYDVTVTPSNVATVWNGDKPAKSLKPVNITYDYGVGDRNRHTARRSGSDAVEFIICSWIHGRHIINVEFVGQAQADLSQPQTIAGVVFPAWPF